MAGYLRNRRQHYVFELVGKLESPEFPKRYLNFRLFQINGTRNNASIYIAIPIFKKSFVLVVCFRLVIMFISLKRCLLGLLLANRDTISPPLLRDASVMFRYHHLYGSVIMMTIH